MELVASLPPDLAAIADPTARAAAPPLRATDQDDAAAAAAVPFEWLLGLLTTPLPGGESLPPTGNALPAAAVGAACDSTAPSSAPAKPVTSAMLASATGADLLARLKLAASPTANDQDSTPPAPATDAANATAPPFAELDPAATADVTGAKPPAAASVATAQTTPGADAAAAIEAALPPPTSQDATPKPPRAGQARAAQHAVATPAVATAADLDGSQASAMTAATPVAEVADAAARPVHRDATLDAFALPATPPAADPVAAATGAPPAVAPTQSHVAAAAAPTADASALAAHGAAIDTRADNWHEALASRVQVLVDQHVGEAHIKLNPPELGAVDIKISLVDDKTFVQLTAGNSAARDELTQSLPRLRELLSAGGLSLGGASVHGGSAGQGGQAPAPRFAVPAYAPFATVADDELAPVRAAARAPGRIDLFA